LLTRALQHRIEVPADNVDLVDADRHRGGQVLPAWSGATALAGRFEWRGQFWSVGPERLVSEPAAAAETSNPEAPTFQSGVRMRRSQRAVAGPAILWLVLGAAACGGAEGLPVASSMR
jgi:hypothetical protein